MFDMKYQTSVYVPHYSSNFSFLWRTNIIFSYFLQLKPSNRGCDHLRIRQARGLSRSTVINSRKLFASFDQAYILNNHTAPGRTFPLSLVFIRLLVGTSTSFSGQAISVTSFTRQDWEPTNFTTIHNSSDIATLQLFEQDNSQCLLLSSVVISTLLIRYCIRWW